MCPPARTAARRRRWRQNFGAVGLGTDTGNSIRGPSSHNLLAGIPSTMGLTSRDGIVPLYLDHDVGGPMARTVADAVAVFDVIAGHDPADPVTAAAEQHGMVEGTRYADHLDSDGLRGARLGRQLADAETGYAEIKERFEEALADLADEGATAVDVRLRAGDPAPRATAGLSLRRRHPDASEREIESLLRSWMSQRPGAEDGDADGRPIEWPRESS